MRIATVFPRLAAEALGEHRVKAELLCAHRLGPGRAPPRPGGRHRRPRLQRQHAAHERPALSRGVVLVRGGLDRGRRARRRCSLLGARSPQRRRGARDPRSDESTPLRARSTGFASWFPAGARQCAAALGAGNGGGARPRSRRGRMAAAAGARGSGRILDPARAGREDARLSAGRRASAFRPISSEFAAVRLGAVDGRASRGWPACTPSRSSATTGTFRPTRRPSARPGAVAGALAEVNTYPHGGYGPLVPEIARYAGVAPENIVLGAGADDLILLCARAFAGPGRPRRRSRRADLSDVPGGRVPRRRRGRRGRPGPHVLLPAAQSDRALSVSFPRRGRLPSTRRTSSTRRRAQSASSRAASSSSGPSRKRSGSPARASAT